MGNDVKSLVISSRLNPGQYARLERKARKLGLSTSETSARLIEEGLRREEFMFVDFRDSQVGRQAYIQGSTLAVWEVVWIARGYAAKGKNYVEKTAKHLCLSLLKVQAALSYAEGFPEIDLAIQDHRDSCDFNSLKRMLPQATMFPLPPDAPLPDR